MRATQRKEGFFTKPQMSTVFEIYTEDTRYMKNAQEVKYQQAQNILNNL